MRELSKEPPPTSHYTLLWPNRKNASVAIFWVLFALRMREGTTYALHGIARLSVKPIDRLVQQETFPVITITYSGPDFGPPCRLSTAHTSRPANLTNGNVQLTSPQQLIGNCKRKKLLVTVAPGVRPVHAGKWGQPTNAKRNDAAVEMEKAITVILKLIPTADPHPLSVGESA